MNAQWDILDTPLTTVLRSEPVNSTQLTISSFSLPVGVHAVRLNTTLVSSLVDLSGKTVLSLTYVNVTKSTLVAGIDGSSYITPAFNTTVHLSAYNGTFAGGFPATDKTGMVFEWRCKRSNDTWPTVWPTQSHMPYNGTDGTGCFGDVGPGVLGFADGLWNFRFYTGYLEPLVKYDVQFAVWKDKNFEKADVSVYVQQPLAPVVSTRSV